MILRREQPSDVAAVHRLTRQAFGRDLEADLLAALRQDAGWLPDLSLVAVVDEQVVGHVVCTRGAVDGAPAVGLGPISVAPGRQRTGIGSALVHAVVAVAEATGEHLVALLGEPAFYGRLGFVAASGLGVDSPDPQWGASFQARRLTSEAPTGAFSYARPFQAL